MPLLFRKYGIEYTEDYEKAMYDAAERRLPSKKPESLPKAVRQAASRYEVEQQNYKEAAKQAEEWFMPRIKYLSPRKIKETERAFGKDYRRGWLTKGEFTKDDFMIAMEYLRKLPDVPRTEADFYDGLIDFLTEQWDESEKQALHAAARKLIERNAFYFTRKDAVRYCGTEQNVPEKMVSCGVVRRTGKWYHFWNQKMMLHLAAQSIREMNAAEKERYYGEDIWNNWLFVRESGWAAYLAENDRPSFEEYLAGPLFARFLNEIPGRSRRAREEWLMREMKWEWQIIPENGQGQTEITLVYHPPVIEVFDEIEWDITGEAYDVFEQAAETGLKEGKFQKFGKEVQGHIEIHVEDVLDSKIMRKFLMEQGCFDAMGRILETMERYVPEQ